MTDPTPETPPAPAKKPRLWATWSLLALLVGMYLFTMSDKYDLDPWAAYYAAFIPERVTAGEYWRFITANLLHADWHHLLSNCFGILIFGQMLEPLLGFRLMWVLFVATGLGAMALSYALLPAPTLGASGIDYGLIGCYIGIILMAHKKLGQGLGEAIRSAITYIVVFVVWNLTEIQQVNLWGHLGGLLVGLQFGLLFGKRLELTPEP